MMLDKLYLVMRHSYGRLPLWIVSCATMMNFACRPSSSSQMPSDAIWTATKGTPVPDRFSYLLFPCDSNVELLDTSNHKTGLLLDRAIVCEVSELRGGDAIGIWVGDREMRVSRNRLTCNPAIPDVKKYIDNWKKEVKSWGNNTEWPEVDAEISKISDGGYLVRLIMSNTKGLQEKYEYHVQEENVNPLCWRTNKAKKMAN